MKVASVQESAYLTEDQLEMMPETGDVAFFREHGWWISPMCLDDDLIDDVNYGAERYYLGERDWPLMINIGTDPSSEQANELRANDYLSLQMEEFRRLIRHPLLPAMAARLIGTSEIRLFHDQLLCKPASTKNSTTAIGWHTDKSYWSTCTSENMLTAWVPFQDCTVEMGPIAVLDGSHRWDHHDDLRNFSQRDLSPIEQQLQATIGMVDPVVLELKRGQVSFHHCRTIHGSRPNTGKRTRLACAIHYQDGDNRYNPALSIDGKKATHINDLLCRRDADNRPDYSDPDLCPRLWPPTSPASPAASR